MQQSPESGLEYKTVASPTSGNSQPTNDPSLHTSVQCSEHEDYTLYLGSILSNVEINQEKYSII